MKNIFTQLIITLIIGIFIAGCDSSDNPVTSQVKPEPSASNNSLARFASDTELEEYLKKGLTSSASAPEYRIYDMAPAPSDGSASENSDTSSGAKFSKTNLQESGVDEADTIKSDGRYLYIAPVQEAMPYGIMEDSIAKVEDISEEQDDEQPLVNAISETLIAPYPDDKPEKQVIRIMELSANPASSVRAGEIILTGFENRVEGLYLLTDRADNRPNILVTIGGQSADMWRNWCSPWTWRKGTAEVALFNVDNPASPQKMTNITIDGQLVSTRRIGEMLYLVTRYTPNLPDFLPYPATPEEEQRNEDTLARTQLSDLLPDVNVDGVDTGALIEPAQCFLPPVNDGQMENPSLITVTAIDLTNPENRMSQSVAGPSETVYVSTSSLYLATTRYQYRVFLDTMELEKVDEESIPPETTDIHKFDLTATGPIYKGSGSVTGNLGWEQDKKPFRMSEYDGILRIATSLGDSWNDTSSTRLTLFSEGADAKLTETAHIDSIGETGERLYAARFVGNRGYLVTFRVTDPLYVFDLSDPAHPAKLGELHINGYSDYLHPINDDLLLGIGKDAVAATNPDDPEWRGAWYQGVKISLFDISDPAGPREVDSMIYGKRGTESDALFDHHALSYLPADETNPARLALPMRFHDTAPENNEWFKPSDPSAYWEWTHTGLYLFSIETGAAPGLSESGKMIVKDRSTVENPWNYWSMTTDRSIILEDSVHYIHDGMVWSSTWGKDQAISGPQ